MRVSLMKNDKISDLILPNKIKGNYWITDIDEQGNEKNLICIEANQNKWRLISNNEISYIQNDTSVPYVDLEVYNFYILKKNNVSKNNNLVLYCSPVYDETYISYDIENNKNNEITIGSGRDCFINYNSVNALEIHASITFFIVPIFLLIGI